MSGNKKLNILINAYAVSPNWGSEPGMGWNWIINIAKYCNVFVITEGEWKDEVLAALNKLPQKNNIHFYFNPLPDKVRKMCWNQGDWRFYYYYRQWQKKTLCIAKQICKEQKIDIIHQLNMVGFREPGLLWKIEGPKYVWGPIGGMAQIPMAYMNALGFKQKLFYHIKNTINKLQYTYQPSVHSSIKRSSALIAAVKEVKEVLKSIYNRDAYLINETGCSIAQDVPVRIDKAKNDIFNIIWVGRFIDTKQLDLALQVIDKVKDLNVKFHICGTGDDEQVARYKSLAENLEINDKCVWYGKVEHSKIQQMMALSDLFFFTSIMEATSTVILEAINSGLPILCFDTCGFGPIINDNIGRKIHLSNPGQSICDFAYQIRLLYNNPEILNDMSHNEILFREELSWDSKARTVVQIYNELLS